jgi:hypothetical protein
MKEYRILERKYSTNSQYYPQWRTLEEYLPTPNDPNEWVDCNNYIPSYDSLDEAMAYIIKFKRAVETPELIIHSV